MVNLVKHFFFVAVAMEMKKKICCKYFCCGFQSADSRDGARERERGGDTVLACFKHIDDSEIRIFFGLTNHCGAMLHVRSPFIYFTLLNRERKLA